MPGEIKKATPKRRRYAIYENDKPENLDKVRWNLVKKRLDDIDPEEFSRALFSGFDTSTYGAYHGAEQLHEETGMGMVECYLALRVAYRSTPMAKKYLMEHSNEFKRKAKEIYRARGIDY